MAFNENNINAAKADISTEQPTYQKNATLEFNERSIKAAGSDVATGQPTNNIKATLYFDENNLLSTEADINKIDYDYYEGYTKREIPQSGNVYTNVESKIKVPYNVPEITDYAPELYEGVTYAELEQLETDVSEVSLIRDSQSRIIGIQINEIQIDVVI